MVNSTKTFIIVALCFLGLTTTAQKDSAKIIDWKFLSHVDYEDKYYPELEAWYLNPIFDEKIKALDGEQVIIKGYIIPLDVEGGLYALSAYPFSACFFCGGAGPESVMSLQFLKTPKKYETDDVVHFTGILKLNTEDIDNFNYILQKVEEIDS